MRVLAWACILALAGLALAGCGGKGSDTTTDPVVTSGSVSSRGTGGNNHPPTGSLRPSVVAGAAPLAVNFTLDGSDQDKDKLSWTLDVTGDGKPEKNGNTLPATYLHTYRTPGAFNVTYKLSDGKADVTFPLTIRVTAPTINRTALLKEDAEGDASKWTLTDEVVLDLIATRVATGQPHPQGGWEQVTTQFHAGAKSWKAHYPDHYEARMTLTAPIQVPPGGAKVSFWAKGGAEDNNSDGLYVNAGPDAAGLENIIYQAKVLADWTQLFFDVEEGPLVLQFLFRSDASCSGEPQPVGGPVACAAGWDAGGFFVDDIEVF